MASATASAAPEPATALAAVDCTLDSNPAPDGAPANASCRASAPELAGNSHSNAAPSQRAAQTARAPRSPSRPSGAFDSPDGVARGHTSSPATM